MKTLGFKSIHLPLSMQQIEEHTFANDAPVAERFEELDLRYPGSKFIYTTREAKAWLASCQRWLEPQYRQRWFAQLPGDAERHWVSECDRKLYGRSFEDMPRISPEELIAARGRHEQRVMSHFQYRPEDLLVLDITDPESLPYTQLVQFLEKNRLLIPPWQNRSQPYPVPASSEPGIAVKLVHATDSFLLAEEQVRLARVWGKRGKHGQARKNYEKALWLVPHHPAALDELGQLLIRQGQLTAAIEHYRSALESRPNEAALHKGLVNALDASGDLQEAFRYYRLERRDQKPISVEPGGLLCCLTVRNEFRRLPFFLAYYRELGIRKFFVVDNDSTDGSLGYLQQQPDVHVWQSALSFNRANFGSAWFELLLRSYGRGHWCLIVDIDELLYFPGCENRGLPEWCAQLERKGKTAFQALMLDMYSELPVDDVHYEAGQDYRQVCPYFDREFYTAKCENAGPYRNQTLYFGGVRNRVFGQDGQYPLSKVPLLKYDDKTVLAGGQHWTNCSEAEMATESGCLLHFKFLSTFRGYVASEIERKEHADDALQYQAYAQTLSRNQSLKFYDHRHSVKFQDSAQLVKLGIMRVDADSDAVKWRAAEAAIADIHPVDSIAQRPFWSVMITVYDRVAYLPRALNSVLEQAPESPDMEIVVVSDAADDSTRAEIQAIIAKAGRSRVSLHQTSSNAGHPEIFNVCLRQARGQWVHILHDDDWVLPGFYRAMANGIAAEPRIGAAACRGLNFDRCGNESWVSWLERATAGVPDNWLERLALSCRLQFSAVVVRREVYKKLGGFDAEANSAFDWDMWKRIAIDHPFWFEPEILACSSKDGHAETDRLRKSGQQIADARHSIARSNRMFPELYTDELSRRAYDGLTLAALKTAGQLLESGDHAAALANISEGLKCISTDGVTRSLLASLARNGQ